MKLTVNSELQLKDIQAAFNKSYPYLKLEFFKNKHGEGQPSSVADMLDRNLYLHECSSVAEAVFDIHADIQVKDLEKAFQEKLGLPAQVFRLSGKVWIETSKTDEWTLAQQHAKGEEMDKDLAPPKTYDQRIEDNAFDNI